MPLTRHDASPGRLLGLDFGEQRIGCAVADSTTGVVRALATLHHRDVARDAAAIATLVSEHRVTELVVGLPLRLDGSEGEQAAVTRAWAEGIGDELEVPVRFRDERFSSIAAEERLPRARRGSAGGPPSQRARRAQRSRIDREAAAGILRAEMEARAGVEH